MQIMSTVLLREGRNPGKEPPKVGFKPVPALTAAIIGGRNNYELAFIIFHEITCLSRVARHDSPPVKTRVGQWILSRRNSTILSQVMAGPHGRFARSFLQLEKFSF